MRLRIVPLMCMAAASLLTVKTGNIWLETSVAFAQPGPAKQKPAAAKPAAKTAKAPDPAAADAKPAAAPDPGFPPAIDTAAGTSTGAAAQTPAQQSAGAAPASASGDGTAGTPGSATAKAAQQASLPDAPPMTPESSQDSFSPAEVQVLQSLVGRRAEIDKRSQMLDQREAVLKVTEQRVEEKITRLKDIETTIQGLLKQADAQQEAKFQSLVRIYETMKPKEAARIFEQLDMPVLLEVLDRMKEMRSGPILASMEPEKAKLITMAMAERRKLPDVQP